MVNFVGVYTVIISCFLYLQKKMECDFIVVFRSCTPFKKKSEVNSNPLFF